MSCVFRNTHFVSSEQKENIPHCLDLIRAKAHLYGAAEINNQIYPKRVTRVDVWFRKKEFAIEAYDKIEKFLNDT